MCVLSYVDRRHRDPSGHGVGVVYQKTVRWQRFSNKAVAETYSFIERYNFPRKINYRSFRDGSLKCRFAIEMNTNLMPSVDFAELSKMKSISILGRSNYPFGKQVMIKSLAKIKSPYTIPSSWTVYRFVVENGLQSHLNEFVWYDCRWSSTFQRELIKSGFLERHWKFKKLLNLCDGVSRWSFFALSFASSYFPVSIECFPFFSFGFFAFLYVTRFSSDFRRKNNNLWSHA